MFQGPNLEAINILVAGKSQVNVDLAKAAYQGMGYQVIPAPGTSLALFLAQKNFPDLIICDERLTDGDGLSFLSELKSDPELAEIPFVFLVDKEVGAMDENVAITSGAINVFYHPIDAGWLKECTVPIIAQRVQTKEKRPEQTPE
jgi:CheY-like chemotaxis protein